MLWEKTDSTEYIKINYTQISEEELKEKNIKFVKDDNEKVFYVEKNSFQKLKDYTYRALGTPITVVLDSVTIVVCAVGVAGAIAIKSSADSYAKDESKREAEENFNYQREL